MIILDQDGLGLGPAEISAELASLCMQREIAPDFYGLGGVVEEVEQYFAKVLGKERALFMPTGTLANQLALRALAGDRRRAIVQDVSHVYNDTGDACQSLSGMTLLPLAPERATFTWQDVERALDRTAGGRVKTEVGVLSIESPVRRRQGELFDHAEMLRVCTHARERGIGLHLDGARLFIASAYTGIAPAQYAAPFDTVYVSLWKYFNALNGAILAGPRSVLDNLFHARRMYGGALFNAWPCALLARHYSEGFVDRLKSAIGVSEEFMRTLAGSGLRIERIPNGTNVFRIAVPQEKAAALRTTLLAQHIRLGTPAFVKDSAVFSVNVNETWNRTQGSRLAEQFRQALTG